jgi:hypothetical protein
VREEIPLYDPPPPHSQRELFRSLSVEEPPQPKTIYFNRVLSLDTRLSCALVYWTTRGNSDILHQCSKWIDESSYQEDLLVHHTDQMSIQQRKDGRYLVWVQLLWQSEKRSEIVEDEEEYYSQHDPARQFREMELKSLATKELVNEEEMEDGDFSDEESEGSADSVRDDEDEENSVTTVTDSTAKLPQDSSRRVPLKPRHKRLYEAMLADDYAMAILHLSATDYLDDTVTPPDDFKLYEDSQKICQRSSHSLPLVPLTLSVHLFLFHSLLACSKYLHDELSPHLNKLLSFALEGPSDEESYRYSHPFQIISSLLQQDASIGLAEIIRQEIPLSTVRSLLIGSLALREGIVDNIFRSNAISLLSHLFGGLETFYFHPSLSPMHQHTIPLTEKYRQARAVTDTTSTSGANTLSAIKLFRLCKQQVTDLIEHISETIYKTRREDLLPCGDTGRCYLSRAVRLLTIFADLDDILVWSTFSFHFSSLSFADSSPSSGHPYFRQSKDVVQKSKSSNSGLPIVPSRQSTSGLLLSFFSFRWVSL